LIYSPPPQHVDLRYRPSYTEMADAEMCRHYQDTANAMIASREGSEYVRRKIAQIELENRLSRMAALRANWDTYGSEAPSAEAVAAAAAIGKAFINFGLIPDAVSPSAEGGVAICFLRNKKYADIECFNSGETIAVRYSSSENPKAWVVQPNDVAGDANIQFLAQYLSA
jgi:hypothetical protein